MSRTALWISLLAVFLSDVGAENATVTDSETCGLEEGPWGLALEAWAVGGGARERRVLTLPSGGYYVTDRVGLAPPPPGPYSEWQPPPPAQAQVATGKIVNKPPGGHNKDKFRPSPEYHPGNQVQSPQYYPQPIPTYAPENAPYPPGNQPSIGNQYTNPGNQYTGPINQHPGPDGPTNQYPGPPNKYPGPPNQYPGPPKRPTAPSSQHPPGSNDRVDAPPPRKEVSETDLFLLAAIEKLVYRADTMEKRLRKAEEALHTLLVGKEPKPEPCAGEFRRVGDACYWWSDVAVDWQAAARACRQKAAAMVELARPAQRRRLADQLQGDKNTRDLDWWTGGLNPGLLWIWSGSGRPVLHNTTGTTNSTGTTGTSGTSASIPGEGRCLALVWDDRKRALVYHGQDCALRHRYVCEKAEDKSKLSNDIERAARRLRSPAGGGAGGGAGGRRTARLLPPGDD